MSRRTWSLMMLVTLILCVDPGKASAQQANPFPFLPFSAPSTRQTPPAPAQIARPFWMPAPAPRARQPAPGSFFPWFNQPAQRRPQPAAPSFFPWFSQASATRGYGYTAPNYGTGFMSPLQSNPTSIYSGMNMNAMMAPMMQGAMGFVAPMAMNYAVASMNPTTMTNFFQLMAQPNSGFGGMGFGSMPMFGSPFTPAPRAPAFPFAAQPTPATPPNPFAGFFGR